MKPTDPQGLLSTLPSVITTYIGLEHGRMYAQQLPPVAMIGRSHTLSWACLLGGLVVQLWNPIIKKLWTVSYALVTAGISGGVLSSVYFFVDVETWGYKTQQVIAIATKPLVWLGRNPLFIFIGMIVLEILLMDVLQFNDSSAWSLIYTYAFASWIWNKAVASLLVSLIHTALWTVVAFVLYNKNIIIKL